MAGLRRACGRWRTFAWMVVVLMGVAIRPELAGLTSSVRVLELAPPLYLWLLALFHCPGLQLDRLTALWVRWCRQTFTPLRVGPYLICLADSLKLPKEGRKMPAVKKLHQPSQDNTKAPFISGHSLQVLCLLVAGPAVPLAARIHEGLVWSDRDRCTPLDKLVRLFQPGAASMSRAPCAPATLLSTFVRSGGSRRVARSGMSWRSICPPRKPRRAAARPGQRSCEGHEVQRAGENARARRVHARSRQRIDPLLQEAWDSTVDSCRPTRSQGSSDREVRRHLEGGRLEREAAMIDLRYSLVVEATADPNFFGFCSPDLEGFSGVGHSIEDCLCKARWGAEEHVALLREHHLPIPDASLKPTVVIQNERCAEAAA